MAYRPTVKLLEQLEQATRLAGSLEERLNAWRMNSADDAQAMLGIRKALAEAHAAMDAAGAPAADDSDL